MQQLNADARQGRNLSGIIGAGYGVSFQPHPTATPATCQLADLRQQAETAKQTGDREAFWQARRAFLLAQATAYQAGEVER